MSSRKALDDLFTTNPLDKLFKDLTTELTKNSQAKPDLVEEVKDEPVIQEPKKEAVSKEVENELVKSMSQLMELMAKMSDKLDNVLPANDTTLGLPPVSNKVDEAALAEQERLKAEQEEELVRQIKEAEEAAIKAEERLKKIEELKKKREERLAKDKKTDELLAKYEEQGELSNDEVYFLVEEGFDADDFQPQESNEPIEVTPEPLTEDVAVEEEAPNPEPVTEEVDELFDDVEDTPKETPVADAVVEEEPVTDLFDNTDDLFETPAKEEPEDLFGDSDDLFDTPKEEVKSPREQMVEEVDDLFSENDDLFETPAEEEPEDLFGDSDDLFDTPVVEIESSTEPAAEEVNDLFNEEVTKEEEPESLFEDMGDLFDETPATEEITPEPEPVTNSIHIENINVQNVVEPKEEEYDDITDLFEDDEEFSSIMTDTVEDIVTVETPASTAQALPPERVEPEKQAALPLLRDPIYQVALRVGRDQRELTSGATQTMIEEAKGAFGAKDSQGRVSMAPLPWEKITKGQPPIISITSPKGGSGKSSTAMNLAALMAENGRLWYEAQRKRGNKQVEMPRVVVFDGDIGLGSLSMRIAGVKEPNVMDLIYDIDDAKVPQTADELRENYLLTHQEITNLSILGAPTDPDVVEDIQDDDYSVLMNLLREHFDVIIIDTGIDMTRDHNQFWARSANIMYVLTQPEVVTLDLAATFVDYVTQPRASKRNINERRPALVNRERINLIIMQSDADWGITDVEKHVSEWFINMPGDHIKYFKDMPMIRKANNGGHFLALQSGTREGKAYARELYEIAVESFTRTLK